MMIFSQNKNRKIFLWKKWNQGIYHQSIIIYYYNPKMPKQHWLKEFMELKLGNLPAQAFTDKFNKACDKPGKKFNVYMEKNTS